MRIVSVMLLVLIGFVFVMPVTAQADEPPEPVDVSAACREAVDGMTQLMDSTGSIPEHLLQEDAIRTADDFHVNRYFTVLDQLTVEEDYYLDYVYMYDFMGGRPFLYVLPEGQKPFDTFADYAEAAKDKRPHYLDHVVPEDSPTGYMQLAVLDVMGEQFYLHWHANYNDYQIVCDAESLKTLLTSEDGFGQSFPPDVRQEASAIDVTPTVTLYDDVAEVRAILFTKWGGFFEWTVTIDRQFPRAVYDYVSESLVAYDCGVMF